MTCLNETSAGVNDELVEALDRRDVAGKVIDNPLPANGVAVMPDIESAHGWNGRGIADTGDVCLLSVERGATLL